MSMKDTARDFVDACDSGKGWEACREMCHDGATFSTQGDALAEVRTLADYTEWAKSLLGPMPDARYELTALGADESRHRVAAAAVFHGTHTVDAGNGAPTGKAVASDYVYVMDFDGGKIRHMTKVWNDGFALRQLGWG